MMSVEIHGRAASSIKNMHSVFWVLFQPWVVKINRVSLSQARHSLSILCSKQKKTRVICILLDYYLRHIEIRASHFLQRFLEFLRNKQKSLHYAKG